MATDDANRLPTGVLLLRDRIGDFKVRVTWPGPGLRPPGELTAGAVVFGAPEATAAVARDAAAEGVLVLVLEAGVDRVDAVVETLGWLVDHRVDFDVDTGRLALVAIDSAEGA